jgi:hypothetical protein
MTIRTLGILAICGVLLASAPVVAIAGSDAIINANNQIKFDLSGTYLDYLETNGSTPLDSERGWVPGISMSGSVMKDWGVENLYLYGEFGWAKGYTNYVGSLSGGNYGDLRQTDGAEIFNEDFRVGKVLKSMTA